MSAAGTDGKREILPSQHWKDRGIFLFPLRRQKSIDIERRKPAAILTTPQRMKLSTLCSVSKYVQRR